MDFCIKLQVVPTHLNLASLESVDMLGCCQMREFPKIVKNITELVVTDTMLQDLPESIRNSSCLQTLRIFSNHIETLADLFETVPIENDWIKDQLENRASDIKDIKKLPDWIKDLHGLQELTIFGCPKLASLPYLPASLRILEVLNCESLETLMPFPSESAIEDIYFSNCLKLGEESRRVITQQSKDICMVPGRNVPAEFEHRAIGNSLTIPSGTDGEFRVCVVVSPTHGIEGYAHLLCHQSCNDFTSEETMLIPDIPKIETEHQFILHFTLPFKLEGELLMEFSTISMGLDIIECGFQILTDKTKQKAKRGPCGIKISSWTKPAAVIKIK